MSSTAYGNTTANGINIDDMVNDNRDIVYPIYEKFFARLVCSRDNIQDEPKPAIAAFSEDDIFYAIFAKVLPGSYEMYWDEGDTTDLFGIELDKFITDFCEFSNSFKVENR